MDDLGVVDSRVVRASIAALMVPSRPEVRLGTVRLHDHQAEAVARLESAISRYGGALLCDPVGTGKTFTALALAKRYRSVTVVAPAALESMWVRSAARAEVQVRFIAHQSLSRARGIRSADGLVIIDEAHHARNPLTRRYRALCKLVEDADVLLATATPVHNKPRDLFALQALYLGRRAALLDSREVSETIIRRESAVYAMPNVAPVEWIESPGNELVPELLVNLPPALPPRDGGTASMLISHSLVRQWASSDAALRLALKRRLHRAASLIAALEAGRYPTRDELSAWAIGDDAVQLAFPELIAARSGNISDLMPVVRAHARAVERLLDVVPPHSHRDIATAAAIRNLRASHEGTPIVAFTSYEETVACLYRMLVASGGIAALTGQSGTVAAGPISRREVIERFAPVASGCAPPSAANRVSLLLTTDILSEGLNLQDAGVVIHIDLPFTNARLEQRAGRLARIGSRHKRIYSYAFRPPARAEVIARIESRLGMKLSFELDARAIPKLSAHVDRRLAQWRNACIASMRAVAAVVANRSGFLAVVRDGDNNRMISGSARGISDDPSDLLRAIDCAEGPDARALDADVRQTIFTIQAHLALEASLDRSKSSAARKAVHRRINHAVALAKPHERWRVSALAERARRSADSRGGAALEDVLTSLTNTCADDGEFLERVAALRTLTEDARNPDSEVLALILFVPST
jgi:superfamily II DNA or RNA helicase